MPTIHQVSRKPRKKKILSNPVKKLQTCPQKRGIVLKIRIVSPKKPNSAKRKVARVRLSNKSVITARIVGQGHNLQAFSRVLVRGGRANDLPGVRYTMIKGCLDFSWGEVFHRVNSRSKYGIALEHLRLD